MKRFLIWLGILLLTFAAFLIVRTITYTSNQDQVTVPSAPALDSAALARFQEAITYRTISYSDSNLLDTAHFAGFRRFLESKYPLVHNAMSRTIVKNYTILLRWAGADPALPPAVLMAHQDVVPIEETTRQLWAVDPFQGVVKEGFIWGRGTADDKINLIAILEACEKLLGEGYRPRRTVYLLFGHDEEVGGSGARAVAESFRSQGIAPDLVLDEGGIVTREKVPGIRRNVALIGTSEKGMLTMSLNVEKGGGHAAMPEAETAIDILARALTRLNENKFEPRFSPSTESFIEHIGPEMPFRQRIAFANLWLFRPVINKIYESSNTGNAMIRTTLAPTIINAGIKENVIPTVAKATLNLRLLPGDSVAMVERKIREIIADDRVRVEIMDAREASSVTSIDSYAYTTVDQIVRKTYDSVVATPFLMIAATDSRHFDGVSKGIIKFSPMTDPIGFHGIDERVSVESFRTSIWFFEQLLRDLK